MLQPRDHQERARPIRLAPALDRSPVPGAFTAARGSAPWAQGRRAIIEAYAEHFEARPDPDYPWMLGVRRSPGWPGAVIGARRLDLEPAFCQVYLDAPLNCLIGQHTGADPDPARMAELGNLAVHSRRDFAALLHHIHWWTREQQLDWVIFSLTRPLRTALSRLGVSMLPLGPAHSDRLGAAAECWGRYYEHDPWVLAAHVDQFPAFPQVTR